MGVGDSEGGSGTVVGFLVGCYFCVFVLVVRIWWLQVALCFAFDGTVLCSLLWIVLSIRRGEFDTTRTGCCRLSQELPRWQSDRNLI
jgi:hypothetical protein